VDDPVCRLCAALQALDIIEAAAVDLSAEFGEDLAVGIAARQAQDLVVVTEEFSYGGAANELSCKSGQYHSLVTASGVVGHESSHNARSEFGKSTGAYASGSSNEDEHCWSDSDVGTLRREAAVQRRYS